METNKSGMLIVGRHEQHLLFPLKNKDGGLRLLIIGDLSVAFKHAIENGSESVVLL